MFVALMLVCFSHRADPLRSPAPLLRSVGVWPLAHRLFCVCGWDGPLAPPPPLCPPCSSIGVLGFLTQAARRQCRLAALPVCLYNYK